MSAIQRHTQDLIGRLVSPVVDVVDPDALVSRIDVNALLARVDLDALLERVDVDRLMQRVDVNALVGRVDVDALVARVDLDAAVGRIDLGAVVKAVQVGSVVGDTASDLAGRSLDHARATVARIDDATLAVFDRVLQRSAEDSAKPVFAGPFARLAAWFVDSIVVSISFSILVAIGGYLAALFTGNKVDVAPAGGPWWIAAGIVFWFVYFAVALFLAQRTVGMALVGVQVCRSDGGPVTARNAFIRTLVLPFSFVFGLGFLGLVFGRRRRALHDVAAGTIVVSEVKPPTREVNPAQS